MKINNEVKLDFDDVLIEPKRSEAASRKSVSLEKRFSFKYSPLDLTVVPIIAANMDTTGSIAMVNSLAKFNALTAVHKFYSAEELSKIENQYFYTMGIQPEEITKLGEYRDLTGNAPLLICIDVANGYTQQFVDYISYIRELCPESVIMAGNVATPEMTQELIINGKADIIKVGIGPGSACTTRLKTGVGYPQLSAIAECSDVAHGLKAHICADGGCKNPGDIAKAFGAGADFVMIGGMLAGTDECDGTWEYEVLYEDVDGIKGNHQLYWTEKPPSDCPYETIYTNHKRLRFHGMSSKEAMEIHSGGMDDYKTAEGIEVTVPYKGKAEEVMRDILGGLRSSCAYIGAKNIKDFPKCCTFIRVNRVKENLFSV